MLLAEFLWLPLLKVLEVLVGVLEDVRPIELLRDRLENREADVLDKVDLACGHAWLLAILQQITLYLVKNNKKPGRNRCYHKGGHGHATALFLVALAEKLFGDERDPLEVNGLGLARVGHVRALDEHLEDQREVLAPREAQIARTDFGVERGHKGKMARHVGREDEVDDDPPRRLLVGLGQVAQHVEVARVQVLERFGQVMVLEHRLVVVQKGELRLGLDHERVGHARMVQVVAGGSEEDCKLFHRLEAVQERGLCNEVVQRLEDVGRVEVVVVFSFKIKILL